MEPGTKLARTVSDLSGTVVASLMELESDVPILANLVIGRLEEGILTSIPGDTKPARDYRVPYIPPDPFFRWMGFALTNRSSLSNIIRITPYKTDGTAGEEVVVNLGPAAKKIVIGEELWEDIGNYTHLKITASRDLGALTLIGNEGKLATVPVISVD